MQNEERKGKGELNYLLERKELAEKMSSHSQAGGEMTNHFISQQSY